MQKIYSRINWENFPSEKTAVNESNLNRMDLGLDNLDDRVIALDAAKFNTETANTLIKDWVIDEQTGVITITKLNGEKILFDLNIEKIPVNFTLSDDGIITMTTDDGEQFIANIGAMIPVLTFEDSDTIAVSVSGTGVNKTYSFSIKAGSVTEDKLQPNFLADVKTEVAKAQASQSAAAQSASDASSGATLAESYTHGGTGTREGEDTDNARYYMEQAKAVSAVDIATTEKAGIVKPDGTTITVDEDGTLHGQSKADEMTGATADKDGTSGTVPAPKAGEENMFLRGDGTWAKVSGGSSIAPKATVDPAITNGNAKVTITWGDPDDSIVDGVVLATWQGTKLVMKESGYPENENDGTVLVDNTVKDAYKTDGYVIDNLTNGKTYYFTLFPYSTDGIYNYQASNRLLGNPSLVKLDPCTDMNITSSMGSATVKWTDPDATKTVDGNTATWAKTVLVYKEGDTAPNSPSDGTVAVTETTRNQYSSSGYNVSGLTDGKQYSFALFAVSTENTASDATTATANLWATLTITTGETKLYEKEVTVTYGSSTVSGTFSSIGSVTLQIPWIGETTITSTDGIDTATSVVTISAYESTYSVDLSFLKIVTFADGTDEEIAKMIQAHYNNKINIADYWAVGDTRSVSLSAMSATGVGESHRAQTVQFVIGDFEHDDLTTPINGHSKAAVTLLQKDCLMDASNASNPVNGSGNTENGYMNSSDTNSGGWKSCARRIWCNNVFFAALPSTWQSMVKIVNKKSGTGGGSSSGTEITADKIFLAAEIEIFGSRKYSVDGEGTQYQYYKNATANRYKMPKWSSSYVSNVYWERSPSSGKAGSFCRVDGIGDTARDDARTAYGIAPNFCI